MLCVEWDIKAYILTHSITTDQPVPHCTNALAVNPLLSNEHYYEFCYAHFRFRFHWPTISLMSVADRARASVWSALLTDWDQPTMVQSRTTITAWHRDDAENIQKVSVWLVTSAHYDVQMTASHWFEQLQHIGVCYVLQEQRLKTAKQRYRQVMAALFGSVAPLESSCRMIAVVTSREKIISPSRVKSVTANWPTSIWTLSQEMRQQTLRLYNVSAADNVDRNLTVY